MTHQWKDSTPIVNYKVHRELKEQKHITIINIENNDHNNEQRQEGIMREASTMRMFINVLTHGDSGDSCLWQPRPQHPATPVALQSPQLEPFEVSDSAIRKCMPPCTHQSTATTNCEAAMIISVFSQELHNSVSPPHWPREIGKRPSGSRETEPVSAVTSPTTSQWAEVF